MNAKETVKLTYDAVHLVTVLNYSSLAEMNGFYGKEVLFTEGFTSEINCLFQALGNLGAYPHSNGLSNDIQYMIISNSLMASLRDNHEVDFFINYEQQLNRANSAYRRVKLFTENQLIAYLENLIVSRNDTMIKSLLSRYKESRKQDVQTQLF
ncbi:hypothetical protein [Sunxiuqinia sp. sy24]|uniref:hypothetical protein n=1 Tax=Sunxiuqinia sp. sy24 TaxID=3461495 RepID=UPI0040455212